MNKKTFIRYGLPATLILLLALGLALGSTLQNWQNPSGTNVANIDSNGSLNITGTGSVNFNGLLSTSTSANSAGLITGTGSITVAQPFAGTAIKEVVIGLTSLSTTGATIITYPVAFTQQPFVNGLNEASGTLTMSSGTISFTNGTSGGTVATSGATGGATGIIDVRGP
jgi:hypothetical protein